MVSEISFMDEIKERRIRLSKNEAGAKSLRRTKMKSCTNSVRKREYNFYILTEFCFGQSFCLLMSSTIQHIILNKISMYVTGLLIYSYITYPRV